VIAAFLKSFDAFADGRVQRAMWLTVLTALASMVALVVAVVIIVSQIDETGIGWLDRAIDASSIIVAVAVAWFLFPVAITGIGSFFLDGVAAAVEERSFPGLPPPRAVALSEEIWAGLRFTGFALLLNVLLLPAYIALLFFPPFYAVVFYGVNGYLVGREYYELVALRRLPPQELRRTWRVRRGRFVLAGAAMAFLLTVPVLNLVAPILATAAMVHLFHDRRGGPR
jgi:uncharacterized protein involved in cysteine biosynthesis